MSSDDKDVPANGTGGERFQVDLRGLVDLLARHLYSSPRVFVRELVQNGVDACVQRGDRAGDPRPAVRLVGSDASTDQRMHCFDSGVGLSHDDLHRFLATIGRSSKRDELGLARTDLLGQFGIGLLSCFMVSDEIEVVSLTAGGEVVSWTGRADGSYSTRTGIELSSDDPRAQWLAQGPGSCVSLAPVRGSEHWLSASTITELARHYASWLDHQVEVVTLEGPQNVSPTPRPWSSDDPGQRNQLTNRFALDHFGQEPLASLRVSVPAAGLHGVACIQSMTNHSGRGQGHRVHLKGMLLSDSVDDLLPPWAFFVRCAVDAESLRPTANREGLYADELLDEVRSSLGGQIRRWLLRTATNDPQLMRTFLQAHHLAIRAMCLDDTELLQTMAGLLTCETSLGERTLADLSQEPSIQVTRSIDEFRQVSAVAAAQGLLVVNGGYTYEYELLKALVRLRPGLRVQTLHSSDLRAHVESVSSQRMASTAAVLAAAGRRLDLLGVDVALGRYAPAVLPALYLVDPRAGVGLAADEQAEDDPWAALLGSVPAPARPQLLLNDDNPQIRRILALEDLELATMALVSVYSRALLQGGHPMRSLERAAMDESFDGLLDRALTTTDRRIR